jgi:hypothetical protein
MRNGVAYEHPTPVLPTSGTGSSSSRGLLPTSAAGNFNDGEDLESWEARRQRNLAKGINGNGQGTPLAIAVQQILQPPDPADLQGGGLAADTFSEGLEVRPVEHHGPECPAAERGGGELPGPDAGVALLPTPRASAGERGGSVNRTGARTSPEAAAKRGWDLEEVVRLLKTPTAQLAVNGGSQHPDKRRAGGHGPTLADQVEHELTVTPAATLGSNGAGVSVDWGKYEPAIRRWERILGRPAPCPVQKGKTNYVLAPELPEWMMGLQPGWVTAVPGLTRTAMLKLVGNGVVPQAAALAVRVLLDAIGWLPLRNLPAARALPDHRNPEKETA